MRSDSKLLFGETLDLGRLAGSSDTSAGAWNIKKNLQISADVKVTSQFFKIYLLLCSVYKCLPACMYVYCMCVMPGTSRRGIIPTGTGVKDTLSQGGSWELNLSFLQDKKVHLMDKSSLQPLSHFNSISQLLLYVDATLHWSIRKMEVGKENCMIIRFLNCVLISGQP